jgi:Ca2+-binding RTX toxin-like protein
MAKHTQNSDLNTTWNINTSDDTWTLAEDAKITATDVDGVSVANGITGNTINLLGDLTVTGNLVSGMQIDGDYNDINVGKNSFLDASAVTIGIDVNGKGTLITNAGKIVGNGSAVDADIGTEIINTGIMKGGAAVYSNFADLSIDNSGKMIGTTYAIRADSDDAVIVNQEGGLIKGNTFGIILDDAEGATVTNYGTLKGDVAISAFGTGDSTVINRGAIKGDIDLAGGEDRFDTRGGTVDGKVDGGDGNDTYLVSSTSIKINEQDNHGTDGVQSTVSYTLGHDLENLRLLGKKDTDGTGNDEGNTLIGNKGDNVLKGLGGEDYLGGGKGDDILIGGKGADVFEFAKGGGHDVVRDFHDGQDLIAGFVGDQDSFDNLMAHHVTKQGDDLLITYGDDSLLLKDMHKSDLDYSDFLTII